MVNYRSLLPFLLHRVFDFWPHYSDIPFSYDKGACGPLLSRILSIDYIWWFQPISILGAALMTGLFSGTLAQVKADMDDQRSACAKDF
jgi:hypothetical protein